MDVGCAGGATAMWSLPFDTENLLKWVDECTFVITGAVSCLSIPRELGSAVEHAVGTTAEAHATGFGGSGCFIRTTGCVGLGSV